MNLSRCKPMIDPIAAVPVKQRADATAACEVAMPGNLSKAAADGGASHKVGVAINAFQAARAQFVSIIQV